MAEESTPLAARLLGAGARGAGAVGRATGIDKAVEIAAEEAIVSAVESEDNSRQWLQRPLRELGGQTPSQLAATEPGSREVERVLGRIEHGIFA